MAGGVYKWVCGQCFTVVSIWGCLDYMGGCGAVNTWKLCVAKRQRVAAENNIKFYYPTYGERIKQREKFKYVFMRNIIMIAFLR